MTFSAPKGTKDILPGEVAGWQKAERVFSDVCSEYGFSEIRIPTFEQTEVFARGVGGSSDVVRKEMYTFEDKGGRSMTLRPEEPRELYGAISRTACHHAGAGSSILYDKRFRYGRCRRADIANFINSASGFRCRRSRNGCRDN